MAKPDRHYVVRDLDHPGESLAFVSEYPPDSNHVRTRMFTGAWAKRWERPRLFEIIGGKEVER